MARPKVKGDLKALNVKINADIYEKLDKESITTGIPKTLITEKALNEYLNKKKNRKIGRTYG